MIRVHRAWLAGLILVLSAGAATAQPSTPSPFEPKPAFELKAPSPAPQPVRRDSLWNGILIGTAAGVGSVVVLDALLCDVPDGQCDTPWVAYLTLGGIGAAAGAGIDLLIGRKSSDARTTIRLAPVVGHASKGVRASIRF